MYILFVVSTIVNKFLMKPVVQITVERERREGDFRFKHVQVNFKYSLNIIKLFPHIYIYIC